MISGLVASIIAFAVGAVLDFALTESPYQHGFNIHTVGIILMIVGAVGALADRIVGVGDAPSPHHRGRRKGKRRQA